MFGSWLSRATSSGGSHLLGGYGDQESWSLMYNLFADKMLGLNFVPQSVSVDLLLSPREVIPDPQSNRLRSLTCTHRI